MITRLTAGLDDDKVKDLNASHISSHIFRKRVIEIFNEDIEKLQQKLLEEELISSPSFENEVISILSEIKAMKKLLKYLK